MASRRDTAAGESNTLLPDAAVDAKSLLDSSSMPKTIDDEVEDEMERKLWILKALFFLGGISASTWGRFGLVYYTEKGMTSTQIGILEGTVSFSAMMMKFWKMQSRLVAQSPNHFFKFRS
jgi:hypothetical protein